MPVRDFGHTSLNFVGEHFLPDTLLCLSKISHEGMLDDAGADALLGQFLISVYSKVDFAAGRQQ